MSFIAEIPARVSGIPCLIGVESYRHQAPFRGSPWNCDSRDDYYGYTDCDWRILDRRGRVAEWLERRMTTTDEGKIEVAISQHFTREDPEPDGWDDIDEKADFEGECRW